MAETNSTTGVDSTGPRIDLRLSKLDQLLICLLTSHWLRAAFGEEGPLSRTIEESLVIVAWVANWKPIQTFLYDWWPLKRRRDLYRRLAQADCEITV